MIIKVHDAYYNVGFYNLFLIKSTDSGAFLRLYTTNAQPDEDIPLLEPNDKYFKQLENLQSVLRDWIEFDGNFLDLDEEISRL